MKKRVIAPAPVGRENWYGSLKVNAGEFVAEKFGAATTVVELRGERKY